MKQRAFLLTSSCVSVLALASIGSLAACDDSSTSTSAGGSTSASNTTGSQNTTTGSQNTSTTTGSMNSASSSTGGPPVGEFDCTDASGQVAGLKLTEVTTDVDTPVQAISAPDDPDRLYVVEKHGRIVILENGAVSQTPFLDIVSKVADNGEEGFLGLAFHKDYATNGRFYVHYSAKNNGDNVVEEYHRSDANHDVADPNPVKLVIRHTTAQSNHNGGAVEFGPDGFLYVSMGDGGAQGDPQCDAQLSMGGDAGGEPENLLGKISRFDIEAACDAQTGCPAAPGNPGGRKAYHVGFRNPWRMSFDACGAHDLFVGDVGQNTYEEVDQLPLGTAANCGWPYREATHDYGAPGTCPAKPAGLVEPVAEYAHGTRCSISGGYVYRSSAIPGLRGAYVYGDYCSGEVFYKAPGGAPVTTTLNPGTNRLGAFGQDGRGNVYVLDLSGRVLRIDPM
ncbi:MAG: PQQ-dependent sugar dehydrogenase [Polyangiaceae bacterium]